MAETSEPKADVRGGAEERREVESGMIVEGDARYGSAGGGRAGPEEGEGDERWDTKDPTIRLRQIKRDGGDGSDYAAVAETLASEIMQLRAERTRARITYRTYSDGTTEEGQPEAFFCATCRVVGVT